MGAVESMIRLGMGECSCSVTDEFFCVSVLRTAATPTHGWHDMAEHSLIEGSGLSTFSLFFSDSRRHRHEVQLVNNCQGTVPLSTQNLSTFVCFLPRALLFHFLFRSCSDFV